jgi:very-short-patch-repair endonuclease
MSPTGNARGTFRVVENEAVGVGDQGATIADMVRDGVRRAQSKLIDLSMRNSMLNFKHSEKSARHVRVAGEQIGVLVEALANGGHFDLVPVPPVEQVPADEDTEDFRSALKAAKEVDEDWLAAEDARRAAGNRRRGRDKAAERALRDRVRSQLGMPEWRAATDPKVRAKELGIDPSYDLPPPNEKLPEGYVDNELQTLHFPDSLEAKLSTIYSTARALQEDAGLSALHCAVGFLEWYDPVDAPEPAFAPLLLLPINMEKRIAQGDYVYSITGRDDDESTNAALREKLKQLALDLPEYDPEEGVEKFLEKVSRSLANRPRWKVRRFVTIGLFSFARQVMWADLDPTKWPAFARPESHPLLGQIYGDVAGENTGSIATVYDVDLPEMEQQAPALVTEADASQLSAVIDVSSGKNLVIQGPPGTGKSQAITNIIANAIWHGKTVLFVSEKMAALSVVKNRLDSMNLGQFCLEVHSAKASKTLVLKAIRERMDSVRSHPNIQELERAKSSLQELRQRLTEYAGLINSPAGTTGLTIHQVLWGDFARAELAEGVPDAVVKFRIQQPLEIDRFKLDELVAAGKALDELAASMGEFATPANQPWRGIGNRNLTRFDRSNAIQLVERWGSLLDQLLRVARTASVSGWPIPQSLEDLESFVASVKLIPFPEKLVSEAVLAATPNVNVLDALKDWSACVVEADRIQGPLTELCDPICLAENRQSVDVILSLAIKLGVTAAKVGELKNISARAAADFEAKAQCGRLISDVLKLVRHVDESEQFDLRAEAMAVGFLLHIGQFPSDRWHWRSPMLNQEGVIEDLGRAAVVAKEAHAAAESARFEDAATVEFARSLPSASEIQQSASVLRSASTWQRLFGREYRAAKTVWRTVFPGEKVKAAASSRRLQAAAAWKDSVLALEANETARYAAGRHWRGWDTPFEDLEVVAKWMKAVRALTPPSEAGAQQLRRLAFEATEEELAPVLAFAERAKEIDLFGAFKAAYAAKITIQVACSTLAERARDLTDVCKQAEKAGLRSEQCITKLPEALDLLVQWERMKARLVERRLILPIIDRIQGQTDLDKTKIIDASLNYFSTLSTSAPLPALKHFISADCHARIGEIHACAADAAKLLRDERDAATEAEQVLELRADEWCGGPYRRAPLERLRERCKQAVSNPEQMEKQVDLLNTEADAVRLGLDELLKCWTREGLAYKGVAATVEGAFYRSASEKLMRENPILAQHAGSTHEQARARFQKLDKEILELNRKVTAARVQARPVPPGSRAQSVRDYTDNEMLSHQTGLQKPRIALRRLFTNAGNAIRVYTPCVMMSPMSVAQYLEPGKHTFDLLVIDEASQMRPEDALGALMRCQQAVVVGDPQQLPPTDFFTTSNDDDSNAAQDEPEESILELGRRCWHPMRMLEVHYRSRHQNLISYSNREFYDERLLVYPSPILEDPNYGVSCVRVQGVYEVGQGRNRIEAEAVVNAATEFMRNHIDRSIGIVAINQAQRDLIEQIMDQRAASDPEIQAYKSRWDGQLEEFFIKNLENVQGDERDIILISTVYGKNDEGVFHQHFGPIVRAYGHRRLNVLFTRAKCKLTVFTSLDHSAIVADGRSRGVRVLKEFLEYASSGKITPGRRTGGEPDSDFERWFVSRLNAEGYDAHPQVGVAKYRIDIGVVHPEKPGTYILGVECDGATYHSSKSARDRDRLRQDVLEGLNWRIHRVWSTDWYRNPEREFKRLLQNIDRLRSESTTQH